MTLWRLEWLRLVRTKRWIALLGVYLFFGLAGPFGARYLEQIVSFAGGDIAAEFPEPVPADGLAQYVSNAAQIGTLVAVIIAAGSLAFDAVPEMGVFLRTRVTSVRTILVPRFVVISAALISSFLVGTAAAWYETWVLIGTPDTAGVLAGAAYGAVFLCFVVALVAAVASAAPSVLSTVLISLVILLAMPLVGIVDAIGQWMPTHLPAALASLPGGETSITDYAGAAALTMAATVVLFEMAVRIAANREL